MEQESQKVWRAARLCVWLLGALLAAVCIVSLLIVPRAIRAFDHLERTLESMDALTETADAALTAANSAANAADKLVADNADAVAEAMEQLNSVDFETLNRAINDLSDIVEPLARVANLLSR